MLLCEDAYSKGLRFFRAAGHEKRAKVVSLQVLAGGITLSPNRFAGPRSPDENLNQAEQIRVKGSRRAGNVWCETSVADNSHFYIKCVTYCFTASLPS